MRSILLLIVLFLGSYNHVQSNIVQNAPIQIELGDSINYYREQIITKAPVVFNISVEKTENTEDHSEDKENLEAFLFNPSNSPPVTESEFSLTTNNGGQPINKIDRYNKAPFYILYHSWKIHLVCIV